MGLVLVQGPQVPVAEVDWVKKFLHVDTTADDERIQGLIDAATERLDGSRGLLGRALQQQTWRLELPGWPRAQLVCLPLPPLIAVTLVTYLDSAGAEQTLAADQYRVVDGGGGRSAIIAEQGVTWPQTLSGVPDAVRVTFDAGYTDTESPTNNPVPMPIRQALVLMVQALYDDPMGDLPPIAGALVSQYRVDRLGAG